MELLAGVQSRAGGTARGRGEEVGVTPCMGRSGYRVSGRALP